MFSVLPEVMKSVLPKVRAQSRRSVSFLDVAWSDAFGVALCGCRQYMYTKLYIYTYDVLCFPLFSNFSIFVSTKKSTSRVQGVRPWTICIIYPTRPGTWETPTVIWGYHGDLLCMYMIFLYQIQCMQIIAHIYNIILGIWCNVGTIHVMRCDVIWRMYVCLYPNVCVS